MERVAVLAVMVFAEVICLREGVVLMVLMV